MSLQQIKTMKQEKGFTIVELLIVIVVIGILAAIVIVAFNGVQARANKTAAESNANTIVKKLEAYNAVKSAYPTTQTEMNSIKESEVTNSGISIAAVSVTNGKTHVEVNRCTTGTTTLAGVGAQVRYWDFAKTGGAAASDWINVGTTSGTGVSCTSALGA